MDHEFSTSALASSQVGWDWFSIQLNDNNYNSWPGTDEQAIELMVFQIRREDGSIDPFSSGTLIYPDGSTRFLSRQDFNICVLDTWTSPHTKTVYPNRWQVEMPSAGLEMEIEPYLTDQELDLSFKYWEGAVKISGLLEGREVNGSGYVELTGYAGSVAGEF